MNTENQPLNPGLYKLHRIFFVAIVVFTGLMIFAGVSAAIRHDDGAGIGFIGVGLLPIATAHWFAAQGAKWGRPYGRLISRVIATLWLLGFPIGTVLGIYTWSQTGEKWKSGGV